MVFQGHSRFPEIYVGCTDSSHGQRHASFVLITGLIFVQFVYFKQKRLWNHVPGKFEYVKGLVYLVFFQNLDIFYIMGYLDMQWIISPWLGTFPIFSLYSESLMMQPIINLNNINTISIFNTQFAINQHSVQVQYFMFSELLRG
ncbi:hypothetical protein FGO68_gene3130 [Halteria grandinella]|uniref:Uncharacterized protein n=1 Tax=Halteria grandinella TaxID=5974 RepID=A0A8J8N9R4_HALGN|nr:hypothetical protein FGO68_gene3130 [Halteria grandinella]